MLGDNVFSRYRVEADNNTTEKDKEAINEYNYSVLLADSILCYFNSNDSIALGKCVEKFKDKRKDAIKHVTDDYLKDLFEKNFLEIDTDLDNYRVPQEIIFPISIKDYWLYRDFLENCKYYNIGCDKSGRLYRQIHRCWKKDATRVGVPDSVTTIRDNEGTYHLRPPVSMRNKNYILKNEEQANIILTEDNDNFEAYDVDDIETEEDRKYEELCNKVEKEYRSDPEKFIDVSTYIDGYAFYTDKDGFEYNFGTEGVGWYVLEEEGVYALFNEQKFVKRK